MAMTVRFWGVRGSIAVPGPDTMRYGGNTSCVELRCGDHLLILDGGTGLRTLGAHLAASGAAVDADILFSHTHIDHICGVPFFAPCYGPGNRLRFWAGNLLPDHLLQEVVVQTMAAPLFPVTPDIFKATIEHRDFLCGETLSPRPGITIRTAPLNHPGGATGYRIEYGGTALAYITDTEHRPGTLDANVLALATGAALLIYDCTYAEHEYPAFVGWGHSTWQEGVRLAEAAGTRLAVFHHDPSHDDGFMDGIATEAATRRPGTLVAREGMTIAL